MNSRWKTSWILRTLTLGLVFAASPVVLAAPLGPGFTYQGRLNEAGQPANGSYNLMFTLWDSAGNGNPPVGGLQLGAVDNKPGTQITDGLFTVSLNDTNQFGPLAFNGDARWLQVSVNGTVLGPRQPLTAAPYALRAISSPGGSGYWTANGDNIYNINAGNVGVGTSSPQFGLHTMKFVSSGSGQPAATLGLQWRQASIPLIDDWLYFRVGGSHFVPVGQDGTHAIRKSNKKFHFSVEDTMNSGTLTPQMTLSETGLVGIGTTTPSARLHLLNDTSVRPVYIQSTHPTMALSAMRVDIASSNTGAAAIAGVNTGGGHAGYFQINNASNGAAALKATTNGSGRGVYGWSATGTGVNGVSNSANGYGGVFGSLETPGKGLLVVGQSHLISPVAIGTTSVPSGIMLNVAGTTRTDVLEITGADLAEKFPTSESEAIEPGTVMEIDPDHAGHLRVARGAYNRRVAGVVSGAGNLPVGAVLGNLPESNDGPPIALSGRVWVWCDASQNPIEPGDLLTTSDTAGHAMKVSDHARAQGAVLGKAMTALAKSEKGLVLVLVNLH